MFLHLFVDVLRNSILITGLVVIMMMMIECLNLESRGNFFSGLRRSRFGGVIVGALLGAVPGCMGGFATVSLYTHRMLSFGALIAMMIASSGDEAFVMMATVPKDALWIFALLFGIAVVAGVVTDLLTKKDYKMHCSDTYAIHEEDKEEGHRTGRHFTWRRALLFAGVAIFILALATGHLEHEHGGGDHHEEIAGSINLLSEEWMNIMFAVLSVVVLVVLIVASDHFVEEHLWHHIVVKHLPAVFCWTFGVLISIGVLLNYFDISQWISDNTFLMILLATLVGIIPESGPHMIFVTLYAAGVVPLPVLLASCISQDGHASLPLVAESRRSFVMAKAINCIVALAVGSAAMLFV
ncbi:MAG: arsenic efflux protein [Bacteroidales bacterium]|nr:arsenic efflux protein [Candidatus Cacconaster merdequi]